MGFLIRRRDSFFLIGFLKIQSVSSATVEDAVCDIVVEVGDSGVEYGTVVAVSEVPSGSRGKSEPSFSVMVQECPSSGTACRL